MRYCILNEIVVTQSKIPLICVLWGNYTTPIGVNHDGLIKKHVDIVINYELIAY